MIEKINVVVVVCSSIANVKERTLLRKKLTKERKALLKERTYIRIRRLPELTHVR